jgi:hypothetical protein
MEGSELGEILRPNHPIDRFSCGHYLSSTSLPPESRMDENVGGNQQATDEAEEILLYLEFADFDETKALTDSKKITLCSLEDFEANCTVLGPTGSLTFVGEHQMNLGTCHFYETVKRSRDESSSGGEALKYLGQTAKKTKFRLKHFSSGPGAHLGPFIPSVSPPPS